MKKRVTPEISAKVMELWQKMRMPYASIAARVGLSTQQVRDIVTAEYKGTSR